MTEVVVFSTPGCKNCKALKGILEMVGKAYTEKDMTSSDSISELLSEGVMALSAPVLKIDARYYDLQEIFPGGDTRTIGPVVAHALMGTKAV